ncbi:MULTISPECIES: type II toxin-antitoxin system RelE/ParE family toxin [Herbaspirillum]|jgi:proteic killer suppression protein|uniref:type II toxin-antitoxin system RelE/ParE family toxin n=1 Tax=Herbaspirillum TaxID=963 RepID=UPI000584FDDC|nr:MULTISPECIES: type II toxin-antitoxin system RelE/ParE family toxin [Herbaspirillum]MBN9356666.1 type II toxin-antitoxin system RelE/ParE family toxin [Herbaspirillum huttiense]MCP3655155.1 excinuclease ABC subunit A [Herbaspirillum sp.]MCP3945666.1 excinuclease ABC subunit A [Herbaspirillum sp.]MCP4031982.1 excinuclease ABC subunit A [Herbaspirillum sp.]MCP4558587.1 excinuclease ABC subunit A [Herbaspirillum sp.]
MILSFRCADTEALFHGKSVPRFANIRAAAERKLQMLDAAATLEFLRTPPGNRLESLHGNRDGQHSIRINSQFRLCFMWHSIGRIGASHVEIIDYH